MFPHFTRFNECDHPLVRYHSFLSFFSLFLLPVVVPLPKCLRIVLKYILSLCVQSRSESLQSRQSRQPGGAQSPSMHSYNAPSPRTNSNWPHPAGVGPGFNRPPSRQSFMGTAAPQSPTVGYRRPNSPEYNDPNGPQPVVFPIIPEPMLPTPAGSRGSANSNWPQPHVGSSSSMPRGFQPTSEGNAHPPVPVGFVPSGSSPAPPIPVGFVPTSTTPQHEVPVGFMASPNPAFAPIPSPSLPMPSLTHHHDGPEPPPGFVASPVPPSVSPRLHDALPIAPRGIEEDWATPSPAEGDAWGIDNNGWGNGDAAEIRSPRAMQIGRAHV